MSFIKKLLLGNVTHISRPNKVYTKLNQNLKDIWENKNYNDLGIERILRILLQLLAFILPGTLVRQILGGSKNQLLRRLGVEFYGQLKPIWYLVVFIFDLTTNWIVLTLSLWLTLDTLYFLLSRIMLNDILKQTISYKRSLILTFVNFVEVCLCFAFIYSFIDDTNIDSNKIIFAKEHLTDIQTIYFSFVTAATIGYGDITPKDNIAMIVVIIQILISLFFVVVIISNVTKKLDDETDFNKSQQKDFT